MIAVSDFRELKAFFRNASCSPYVIKDACILFGFGIFLNSTCTIHDQTIDYTGLNYIVIHDSFVSTTKNDKLVNKESISTSS